MTADVTMTTVEFLPTVSGCRLVVGGEVWDDLMSAEAWCNCGQPSAWRAVGLPPMCECCFMDAALLVLGIEQRLLRRAEGKKR